MAYINYLDHSRFKEGDKVFCTQTLEYKNAKGYFTTGTSFTVNKVSAIKRADIEYIYSLKDEEGNTISEIPENHIRTDNDEERILFEKENKKEETFMKILFGLLILIPIGLISSFIYIIASH